MRSQIDNLRPQRTNPATVIDVGVGEGTPWLYSAFPTARFELFEALDVFKPALVKICEQYNADYHLTALGAAAAEAVIDVHVDDPMNSTMSGFSAELSPRSKGESAAALHVERRSIQTRRLDDFGPFAAPVLLKLDVEGFEQQVLEGAPETLKATDIILAEVSVTRRHERDMSIGSFVRYVESRGFSLVDIPELTPLRRGGPLSFVDAAFARNGTRFCA